MHERPGEDPLIPIDQEQATIIGPRVNSSAFRMLLLAVAGGSDEAQKPTIRNTPDHDQFKLPDDSDANELGTGEASDPSENEGPMPGRRKYPERILPQTPADILLNYIKYTIPEGHFPANGNFPGTKTDAEKRQLRVALGKATDKDILKDPESKIRYQYLQELYLPGSAERLGWSKGRPQ